VRRRVAGWLSATFLSDIVRWEWRPDGPGARLQFDVDHRALNELMTQRLGRTVMITNRLDWSVEQIVDAYTGQEHIEQVFRGLKDGGWVGWGPMHHWTDSKIRVHAFYCMLAVSLLKYIQRDAQRTWPGLSIEQLLEELKDIHQVVLFYPPQGEKGPCRTATVISKRTLAQHLLTDTLALNSLSITPRR